MKITEGYMPYLEYKTYYRIVGECTGNKKPLVLLHGDRALRIIISRYLTKLQKMDVQLLCMTN